MPDAESKNRGARVDNGVLVSAAVLVALVCGLHHILFLQHHGGAYTPFGVACMLTKDETESYAPMTAEKLRGEWWSENPYLLEGKDRSSIPTSCELLNWITALLGVVFGLGAAGVFILADFLFPVLCWWGFYRVLRLALPGRSYCAAVSAGVILANDFLTRGQFGLRYFGADPTAPHPMDPLFFSRIYSPSAVLPFLLLALVLLHRMLRKRTYGSMALCGLSAGALFYTYFYHWTAIIAVGGVLFLVQIARRDRRAIGLLLGAFAVCLLVGSSYLWKVAEMHGTPTWELASLKAGFGKAAHPEWWFLGASLVVAAGVWAALPPSPVRRLYGAVLVAGGVLLVTPALGVRVAQPDHWRLHFFKFFLLLAAAAAFGKGVERLRGGARPALPRAVSIAIVLVAAFIGGYRQHDFFRRHASDYTLAPYLGVLTYMQSRPEGVFLTGDETLNLVLPLYTDLYPYCRPIMYAGVPPREQVTRHRLARVFLPPETVGYNTLQLYMGPGDERRDELLGETAPPEDASEVRDLFERYALDYLILPVGVEPPAIAKHYFGVPVFIGDRFKVHPRRPHPDGAADGG